MEEHAYLHMDVVRYVLGPYLVDRLMIARHVVHTYTHPRTHTHIYAHERTRTDNIRIRTHAYTESAREKYVYVCQVKNVPFVNTMPIIYDLLNPNTHTHTHEQFIKFDLDISNTDILSILPMFNEPHSPQLYLFSWVT